MNLNKMLAVVIFFVVAILFFGGWSGGEKGSINIEESQLSEGGWVEVLSGRVFIVSANEKKEIFNGDMVSPGDFIETDIGSELAVYFYDGSSLRVNENTKFVLDKAVYSKNDGKMIFEASLSSGGLWSKIIELATPDSLWQVKTSNAVATVRGTAFGINFNGSDTEIVGSQNKVDVFAIDPDSGEKLITEPVSVVEQDLLIISKKDVEELKEMKTASEKAVSLEEKEVVALKLASKLTPKKITDGEKRDWQKKNEEKDASVEEEMVQIKKGNVFEPVEIRKKIREKVDERVRIIRNKRKDAIRNVVSDKDDLRDDGSATKVILDEKNILEPNKRIEETVEKPVIISNTKPTTDIAKEVWRGIKIITESKLTEIYEGEMVSFKAILEGDNGVTKDVTRESKWEVLGSVGVMDKPGSFMAKLGQEVAEYGEGYGFVVATWEDIISGQKFLGKTSEIKVKMRIENFGIPIEETEVLLR